MVTLKYRDPVQTLPTTGRTAGDINEAIARRIDTAHQKRAEKRSTRKLRHSLPLTVDSAGRYVCPTCGEEAQETQIRCVCGQMLKQENIDWDKILNNR